MSQNLQQPSQDSNISNMAALVGVKWSHAMPILYSLIAILSLLNSVVSIKGHISTSLLVVDINGLGEKSGDADLINLVSSGVGFGVYLLAGNILLMILLVVSALTLNKGIVFTNQLLSAFLFLLTPINISRVSSVTLHTAIPDLSVSQTSFNMSYMAYFLITVSLMGIVYSLPKNPKANSNYASGKRTETNI